VVKLWWIRGEIVVTEGRFFGLEIAPKTLSLFWGGWQRERTGGKCGSLALVAK
jgi:hypothetical protein